MSSLKQQLKNFIYSRNAPEWLAKWFFGRKDAANREKLNHFLQNNVDLLEGVKADQRPHWKERINSVLQSPDNAAIPRHELAGTITDGNLIMHNGIKIDPLSYYSFPLLKMLMDNKGVHEPQEEKIFQEVIQSLDPRKGYHMLELGAYWSFYSMWMSYVLPGAKCVMVEPDRQNLLFGKRNFRLNNLYGTFIHAGIGKEKIRQSNSTSVDAICAEQEIGFLDILHSDIQGFELEMLHGAKNMFDNKNVGYVFISTHSNELHNDCRQFLLDYNFTEVASVNLDESSSWDGILVMKNPAYDGIEKVEVSKGISAR